MIAERSPVKLIWECGAVEQLATPDFSETHPFNIKTQGTRMLRPETPKLWEFMIQAFVAQSHFVIGRMETRHPARSWVSWVSIGLDRSSLPQVSTSADLPVLLGRAIQIAGCWCELVENMLLNNRNCLKLYLACTLVKIKFIKS